MLKQLLTLFLVMSLFVPSYGGEREQVVIDTAGRTATGEVLKKGVAEGLGKEAVGVFGGAVGIGLGAHEFMTAKSDKGRTYAALQTAGSVVMMINPVAGLVVQAAVLVTRLLETMLSAGHMKRMNELAAEIARYRETIAKIETEMTQTEKNEIIGLLDLWLGLHNSIAWSQKYLSTQCADIRFIESVTRAKECMAATANAVSNLRLFVYYHGVIKNLKLRFFKINQFYQAINLDSEAIEAINNEAKANFEYLELRLAEITSGIGSVMATLTAFEASKNSVRWTRAKMDSCVGRVYGVAQKEATSSLKKSIGMVDWIQSRKSDSDLMEEISSIQTDGCVEELLLNYRFDVVELFEESSVNVKQRVRLQ